MSDVTVESLQQELTAAKDALEKATKTPDNKHDSDRLAFLEGEHKKLIGERDKAKEATRIAEEAKLAENGEFKTLAEQAKAQVTELSGQLDGLNDKLAGYQARDAKELETLLPSVPEHLREQVSDETLSLDKQLSLARALSTTKQKPADYRGPGEPGTKTAQDRLNEAIKSGDVMAQIAIKREMSAT